MPLILPLFHGTEYVTDFKEKAELFKSFVKQCFLISNSSEPSLTFLTFITQPKSV